MWKVTLEKILVGVRELGGSMTHNVNWTFIKGRYFPGDEHRDDFIKALEEGEARGLFRVNRMFLNLSRDGQEAVRTASWAAPGQANPA